MAVRANGAKVFNRIKDVCFTNAGKRNEMVDVDEVFSAFPIPFFEVKVANAASIAIVIYAGLSTGDAALIRVYRHLACCAF